MVPVESPFLGVEKSSIIGSAKSVMLRVKLKSEIFKIWVLTIRCKANPSRTS